jgi:hypothetical protein
LSAMSGQSLTPFERQRIAEILSAISAKDWPRFRSLSDEPFLNLSSMREQFHDSICKISDDLDYWEGATSISTGTDGTRLILLRLSGKTPEAPPIQLFLHSAPNRIGIWVFYEEYQA